MYAELQVTTNYSFLRSGSHPGELALQALKLGHTAIGIADRNTLAGVVRAYAAIEEYYEEFPAPREERFKLLVGAHLETRDGYSLLAYPTDLEAYKRLSRLLTVGNRRAAKGECELTFDDLASHAEGILAIVLPPRRPEEPAFRERLRALARLFGDRCYLAGTMLFRGDDARRLALLDNLAATMGIGLVATNDVHYHLPERRALHDVVTAIRLGCTVDGLGFRRFASAERHLKEAQGDGAAVPPSSARHRAYAGDRRALPLLARSAHLPVSGPVRRRRDSHGQARPPHLGGSCLALSRRCSGRSGKYHPPRIRADRSQEDRALLPDRARDRLAGPQDGHSLPGPRLGRQLRRVLLPRHHFGESQRSQSSLRALPLQRTQRTTRHRRRFRARAARAGDPMDLQRERPLARRAGGHGDRLPEPQRHPRGRQGARPVARHGRRDGRHGVGHGLGRRRCRSCARGRPRSHGSPADLGPRIVGDPLRLPPSSFAACRRLRPDRGSARRAGADPERGHGGPYRHRMGQGRSGCPEDLQGRRAGTRHADLPAKELRPDQEALWRGAHHRHGSQGSRRLRHVVQGQFRRRVPGRKPGADVDAAAPETPYLLRPRRRSGDRAAWSHPGRHGPSLSQEPRQSRTGHLSQAGARECPEEDPGRAAVPGTGDADRHRCRGLQAREGRQAAPRHGDVPPGRHHPQAQGRFHRGHGRQRLRRATSPSAASSRSRASASTASPRAMPRASPSWSTIPRG